MSDPLLDLEAEEVVIQVANVKVNKNDLPEIKIGDQVLIKDMRHMDYSLKVMNVYWTGSPETGYWMIDAQFGEDWKARIYAPSTSFVKK